MAENKKYYKLSDFRLRDIMREKYDCKCAYCGCVLEKRFHIDHIRPINRGNMILDDRTKLQIENLNPACPACNISKSSMSLETWRSELKLKIQRIERDSSTYRNLKRFGLVGILKNDVVFYFETL